ncbi:CTP synthase [Candidatus Micrarchaeota archaeon]|nr:CTP synthase [Candidatus Micrarchaeota archaeon]
MPRFIFVTGGVLSSLGKGTFTSSLAKVLKSSGVNVSAMKIDPYLNCDAGTLNPFEHGEVFVTQDGFECDLDLGTYERFLGIFAKKEQNLMMGTVYKTVIEKERRGEFLGKTLQLIPHVTNEIKSRIKKAAQVTGCDVLVVEIGGTVGDIESEIVLEAIRQMKYENPSEVLFIHLALVPTIITGEQKTKPMQHSVRALLARGIAPDALIARSERELKEKTKEKIALFCNVLPEAVFSFPNVELVYELPFILRDQEVMKPIAEKFKLELREMNMNEWKAIVEKFKRMKEDKLIGVVGKYATTKDTYMSIFEALMHAGISNGVKVKANLIDSEEIEKKPDKIKLSDYDGFLIPGGFGGRGTEGKIEVIKYARENDVPLFGICFGFQLSVIEFCRNVLEWRDAASTEFSQETTHPVIDLLPEQRNIKELGGTMRLGVQKTILDDGTKALNLYGEKEILKRHRHRFEVNPGFISDIEKAGMRFSGKSEDGVKMEVLELKNHQYFLGSQFHPEFDSRLEKPEPLFHGLVKATL